MDIFTNLIIDENIGMNFNLQIVIHAGNVNFKFTNIVYT